GEPRDRDDTRRIERLARGIHQCAARQGPDLRADPRTDEEDLNWLPGRRQVGPARPTLAGRDADLRPALEATAHLEARLRHALDPSQAELAGREAPNAAAGSERGVHQDCPVREPQGPALREEDRLERVHAEERAHRRPDEAQRPEEPAPAGEGAD